MWSKNVLPPSLDRSTPEKHDASWDGESWGRSRAQTKSFKGGPGGVGGAGDGGGHLGHGCGRVREGINV